MDRRNFVMAAGALALSPRTASGQAAMMADWVRLPTEPFRGKQDDVVFLNDRVGWYGNGLGRLFKTIDGGQTWIRQLDRPGTFVRALGFVDDQVGFLGNIGPDYFPNVSDATPLYRTRDGGNSWEAVEIEGPPVKGICAIDVQREPFINAGVLDYRTTIRAGGRVGAPAFLATSRDGGDTWTSEDLSDVTAMILDVHFLSDTVGFICGATHARVQDSEALILRTDDGGRSWSPVFRGGRPWEITWKMSWPTVHTGYVTVQSYDPDPKSSARVVAKSEDGGVTWRELPLIDDARVRPFGIGFIDERVGWVGAAPGGFQTRDGGHSWSPSAMGAAVNKVRVVQKAAGGFAVFAIGSDLHRLDL